MNINILKKAEAKILQNKLIAEEKAKSNFDKAFENNEFRELFKQQRELEIQIAKKQAFGEQVDFSSLEQIFDKQEKILNTINLNLTDLKPNYFCLDCKDTGYVLGNCCNCLKKEINKQLLSYSGFTEKLVSFEESKLSHPAYDLMQKWCYNKKNYLNVLISGPCGTGKTFLTECVASELMKQNKLVLFTTSFNLNNSLLNYHISFDSAREEIIKPFLTCECLIIDDLGSEPLLKNVTKEYLYLILNERMLAHLTTIITTNLNINELLENYGERITSRLISKKNTLTIYLDNEDLRLKK